MKTKKIPFWVQKIADHCKIDNETEKNIVSIDVITFKEQGIKVRRKGYEITVINTLKNLPAHEQRFYLTFEPKNYNDSTGLKWFVYGNIVELIRKDLNYVDRYSHGLHVKRISNIYKLLIS